MSREEGLPEAGEVAGKLLEVLELLQEASGLEWRKGDAVARFESEPVSQVGDVSDPTADIALDPRRLRVRAAVWQAGRDAEKLRRELAYALR